MTFLKKLGMVLGNVAGIVAGIGPVASALFPAHAGQIEQGIGIYRQIVAIVQQIELISQTVVMTGPQKLQAAIVQIGALIRMTDMVKTNKIADQALFDQAIAGFAQASVDLQNSLASHEVKAETLSA